MRENRTSSVEGGEGWNPFPTPICSCGFQPHGDGFCSGTYMIHDLGYEIYIEHKLTLLFKGDTKKGCARR